MNRKKDEIIEILNNYGCKYIDIDDESKLNTIHNLLCNNVVITDSTKLSAIEYYYYGWYYCYIKKKS